MAGARSKNFSSVRNVSKQSTPREILRNEKKVWLSLFGGCLTTRKEEKFSIIFGQIKLIVSFAEWETFSSETDNLESNFESWDTVKEI